GCVTLCMSNGVTVPLSSRDVVPVPYALMVTTACAPALIAKAAMHSRTALFFIVVPRRLVFCQQATLGRDGSTVAFVAPEQLFMPDRYGVRRSRPARRP